MAIGSSLARMAGSKAALSTTGAKVGAAAGGLPLWAIMGIANGALGAVTAYDDARKADLDAAKENKVKAAQAQYNVFIPGASQPDGLSKGSRGGEVLRGLAGGAATGAGLGSSITRGLAEDNINETIALAMLNNSEVMKGQAAPGVGRVPDKATFGNPTPADGFTYPEGLQYEIPKSMDEQAKAKSVSESMRAPVTGLANDPNYNSSGDNEPDYAMADPAAQPLYDEHSRKALDASAEQYAFDAYDAYKAKMKAAWPKKNLDVHGPLTFNQWDAMKAIGQDYKQNNSKLLRGYQGR